MAPPRFTFTLFYWDLCGHCKVMMPEWEKLMKKSEKEIDFGMECKVMRVESGEMGALNFSKLSNFPIFSFPTMVFKDHKTNRAITYEGSRTARDLEAFVKEKVKEAKSAKSGGAASKKATPKCKKIGGAAAKKPVDATKKAKTPKTAKAAKKDATMVKALKNNKVVIGGSHHHHPPHPHLRQKKGDKEHKGHRPSPMQEHVG